MPVSRRKELGSRCPHCTPRRSSTTYSPVRERGGAETEKAVAMALRADASGQSLRNAVRE